MLQVEGKEGLALLRNKMAVSGPRVLYAGALGAASATLVGHYPWFLVYNTMNAALPQYDRGSALGAYLARNAAIGFSASAVSDTVSNSIRVLKTTKQASPVAITYRQAAQSVIDKDGVQGLFLRGLKTKILANGLQGMLFTARCRGNVRRVCSAAASLTRTHHRCCGAWGRTGWRRATARAEAAQRCRAGRAHAARD